MKLSELSTLIEQRSPSSTPAEVGNMCLLLVNAFDDIDLARLASDPERLMAAQHAAVSRAQSAGDQYQAAVSAANNLSDFGRLMKTERGAVAVVQAHMDIVATIEEALACYTSRRPMRLPK